MHTLSCKGSGKKPNYSTLEHLVQVVYTLHYLLSGFVFVGCSMFEHSSSIASCSPPGKEGSIVQPEICSLRGSAPLSWLTWDRVTTTT